MATEIYASAALKRFRFFVPGVPVPKGSAKAFMRKGARFPVVIQDNADKQKPWASLIAFTAQQSGCAQLQGPVRVVLRFTMPRLKSHFRTVQGKQGPVKENAPHWHVSKPDVDKLLRCVLDAFTGIVWQDDSQVVDEAATKVYGDCPGVLVEIEGLD